MHGLRIFAVLALAWMLAGCEDAGRSLYQTATWVESALYGLESRAVDLGEVTLRYYEGGDPDGPAVLLVHGFTADKDNWPRFARHLTDDYHVFMPDMAGHGESTWDPRLNHSMPAQAARIRAFVQALGTGPVHIAGNSMGGFIAATFALHYPDSVRSLALFDAAGVRSPRPSPMDEQLARGENPFFFDDPAGFAAFWNLAMEDPPWMPGVVVDYLGSRYVARRSDYEKIFNDFSGKDLLDEQLDRIRAPTLVLWGGQDRLLDVSMAEVYARGIPHAQKVILDGVGHLPMVEHPGESARIYRAFLAKLPSS